MNFYKPASTDRTKGTDCRACLPCVGLGQDQCWLLDLHVQSAFMFRNPKHLPTNRANVCVLFSGGFALRRNCLQGRAIGVFRGYLPPPKYLQEGLKGRRLDKLWTLVSGTGLPLQKITPRMMISMLSTHKKSPDFRKHDLNFATGGRDQTHKQCGGTGRTPLSHSRWWVNGP